MSRYSKQDQPLPGTYYDCQECQYGTTSPKHAHEHFWTTGHDYDEKDLGE